MKKNSITEKFKSGEPWNSSNSSPFLIGVNRVTTRLLRCYNKYYNKNYHRCHTKITYRLLPKCKFTYITTQLCSDYWFGAMTLTTQGVEGAA